MHAVWCGALCQLTLAIIVCLLVFVRVCPMQQRWSIAPSGHGQIVRFNSQAISPVPPPVSPCPPFNHDPPLLTALFLSDSTCGYYHPPVLLSLCLLSNHQTSSIELHFTLVVTFGKLCKAWNFFILHVLCFNWGLQTLFLLLSFASRLLPGAPHFKWFLCR